MNKPLISILLCILFIRVSGNNEPDTARVLFLGNSYTAANNLPQLVSLVAASAGDSVYYESNTPGGYTLEGHSANAVSLQKIMSGNWDYVVLQEQSQRPSLPWPDVQHLVLPYARALDSIINLYNPCAETMFYMTWGRKNGDSQNCPDWPPVCTYEGMDSLLRLRYELMADTNNAVCSPVGAVWHYIRDVFPGIELYSMDESHPSQAGSYAAACSFYASIFRKNPENIPFNYTLHPDTAAMIRNAAKIMVYDSLLKWNTGLFDPMASFSFDAAGYLVNFANTSINADHFWWDFGDGNTSALINPVHTYEFPGIFDVRLVASHCSLADTAVELIIISNTGMKETGPGMSDFYVDRSGDILTVRLTDPLVGNEWLRIYDGYGRQVCHQYAIPGAYEFRINGLESGICIICIDSFAKNKNIRIKYIYLK